MKKIVCVICGTDKYSKVLGEPTYESTVACAMMTIPRPFAFMYRTSVKLSYWIRVLKEKIEKEEARKPL